MSGPGLGIPELLVLLLICCFVLLAAAAAVLVVALMRSARATPAPPGGATAGSSNSAPVPGDASGHPKTCGSCGAFLVDDAKFCHRCGCPV